MFAQSLKLNASRHVLAWRQVHLSAVVAYCVHYQTSHGSACRGVCVYVWVCVRVGEREGKIQTCLSLTVVFSVIAPHPQVFSPDLWRTVNSSRAVSLSPPLSRSSPCHISPLQQNKATPPPTAAWRQPVKEALAHALGGIHVQRGAARGRCASFTETKHFHFDFYET